MWLLCFLFRSPKSHDRYEDRGPTHAKGTSFAFPASTTPKATRISNYATPHLQEPQESGISRPHQYKSGESLVYQRSQHQRTKGPQEQGTTPRENSHPKTRDHSRNRTKGPQDLGTTAQETTAKPSEKRFATPFKENPGPEEDTIVSVRSLLYILNLALLVLLLLVAVACNRTFQQPLFSYGTWDNDIGSVSLSLTQEVLTLPKTSLIANEGGLGARF